MAILDSCCFWQSLRTGSYVAAIYTMIYFATSNIAVSLFLYDERRYLTGEAAKPEEMSFIGNTPTTVIFNILLWLCSASGVIASILAVAGLYRDCRCLMTPWILVMIADIAVEASHFVYVVLFEKLVFKVLTAFIFIIDFFVVALNVYCLLCVISQYQEYKAGRGIRKDSLATVNEISFQPSTDVCHNNMFQSKSSSVMCAHTNCPGIDVNNTNGVNMKFADEIISWNDGELYDPENC